MTEVVGFDFSYVDYHVDGLLRLSAVHPWVRLDLYSGYAFVDRSDVRANYHLLKVGVDLRVTIVPGIISALVSFNAPVAGLKNRSAENFTIRGIGLAIGWQP